MDLRCPKCNSTDLKKVSLAYQGGLYRTDACAGIQGVLVGGNGPNIMVGRTTTKGIQQTQLSERLSPPKKWSYLKLFVWFAVASFVGLVVYIHAVMGSSSASSSVPVKLYALVGSAIFVSLVLLTWRHNHSLDVRQYAQWDRDFLCECCGAISEQELNAVGEED